MFVPLPVPFVFQRTAPDLNAWRLKSPLALRSNSGKIIFSLLPATHPPCPSGLVMQTRPTLLGADALAAGSSVGAHTHLHTHTHTPPSSCAGLNRVLYTCGAAVQIKKSFVERAGESRLVANFVRKMSVYRYPFRGTMFHRSTRSLVNFHAACVHFSEHFSLLSPSPSFPFPPLPAPEPQPPSLPN